MTTRQVINGLVAFGSLVLPSVAWAQDGGDVGGADVPGGAPPGGGVTVVQIPGPAPPPTTTPEGPGINAHLPSSAGVSTDTSSSSDGFDLGSRGGGKATVVRGSAKGSYVVSGQYTPDLHTVKRGDTLWDISGKYYGNHYNWPRIWSFNSHIQNPHWLYPGDHVRLRTGPAVKSVDGFQNRKALVPQGTVFQRHLGYVLDDKARPADWGQVIGSPDDQMLLSEGDQIYIELKEDQDVTVGQLLTLWEQRSVRNMANQELVWIRGIAKVNRYNRKNHMVRAKVLESLSVIERGIRVGPADRKVDVVEPVPNDRTVKARIVAALYPYQFYGQHQVVMIDKGGEDGVKVGNRFFAVSRSDEWRMGLKNAGKLADWRAITEDDRMAHVEKTPNLDQPELYPAETYAELRVVRVRKHYSTCLVTASIREIARGALVVAREGY
ncbi:MAG: LysM peptidoglycan-binding domain-containing protein [Deltaproteobacteria bacterium]|nr:LysM peptidoglycan-binding domain-containing protein [Deltaproteobacteria bacterium]